MIEEKLTLGSHQQEDMDETLRPGRFADFVGQGKVKGNLQVFVEAARIRNSSLDHVILYGPPGLGKTTLAHIISGELGKKLQITSAPALEKQGDLVAILTTLEEGGILFIDEIHRMRKVLEEVMYSAMEDFKVDIIIGEGTGARTLRLTLPRFTLIGATTRMGSLSAPLRSRFGIIERLEYYDHASLQKIVLRSASLLGIAISDDGAMEIAKRSRGTPRISNRLLKRVSDFAVVAGEKKIGAAFADRALEQLEVDRLGLDALDRKILSVLIDHYDGGPAGISAIAAAVSEEAETIEDVCEPYLIQLGFLKRGPRGRLAAKLAYEHLGKQWPGQEPDQGLFAG